MKYKELFFIALLSSISLAYGAQEKDDAKSDLLKPTHELDEETNSAAPEERISLLTQQIARLKFENALLQKKLEEKPKSPPQSILKKTISFSPINGCIDTMYKESQEDLIEEPDSRGSSADYDERSPSSPEFSSLSDSSSGECDAKKLADQLSQSPNFEMPDNHLLSVMRRKTLDPESLVPAHVPDRMQEKSSSNVLQLVAQASRQTHSNVTLTQATQDYFNKMKKMVSEQMATAKKANPNIAVSLVKNGSTKSLELTMTMAWNTTIALLHATIVASLAKISASENDELQTLLEQAKKNGFSLRAQPTMTLEQLLQKQLEYQFANQTNHGAKAFNSVNFKTDILIKGKINEQTSLFF